MGENVVDSGVPIRISPLVCDPVNPNKWDYDYDLHKEWVNRYNGGKVAVKLISKESVVQKGTMRDLITEIKLLKAMTNTNGFLHYLGSFQTPTHVGVITDLVMGQPLSSLLQRKWTFTIRRKIIMARELSSAVKFLHRSGIIHNDIKPENVIMDVNKKVCKRCSLPPLGLNSLP